MKQTLRYLFPLLLVFMSIEGCVKNSAPTTLVVPAGNFAGTFTRLHLNLLTNKIDTITANLVINMSATTGFVVSGDTSHHAASHGTYAVDGQNIAFSDVTLPATPTNASLAKTHLNGVYQYNYAAPSLQVQFLNDTLLLNYTLVAK